MYIRLRPYCHRLCPSDRVALVDELIVGQPLRTNSSIQRLTGAGPKFINERRRQLGAPVPSRRRRHLVPVGQQLEPVGYPRQDDLFTGNGAVGASH